MWQGPRDTENVDFNKKLQVHPKGVRGSLSSMQPILGLVPSRLECLRIEIKENKLGDNVVGLNMCISLEDIDKCKRITGNWWT